MPELNAHYQKLVHPYLFSEIEQKIQQLPPHPEQLSLLNLGIGDATQPLASSIVHALSTACQEMGEKLTFKGYGPSEGYCFLRQAIANHEYKHLGICADEIFISDGANTDLVNIQELFGPNNKVAILDPTYPVYLDTNIIAGRTSHLLKTGRYGKIVYLSCLEENHFQPIPPSSGVDLIYLCSPNNPTSIAMNKEHLQAWVTFAKKNRSIIIYDGAYEAFITSPNTPHSIYEIEGAKEVAIEIRTFSKYAGFTGLRCSYMIIPYDLKVYDLSQAFSLHALWKRRIQSKSNGVSYPIQKAAAATFLPKGKQEIKMQINQYMQRGRFLREGLQKLGFTVYGGQDAPYLWCKTPYSMKSWDFFDFLVQNLRIVAIPGRGFGPSGEGFIRFSAFADSITLTEGLLRIKHSKELATITH